MNVREKLKELVGDWTGTNHLWVSPGDPVRRSTTTASIVSAAGDAFAMIRYTWADRGQPQDGVLMVRTALEPSDVDVIWIDSWHMSNKFMVCRGEHDSEGRVSARGTYAAPPGPDWGWRIVVGADTGDEIHILMYNISPDGHEALAVEARYSRVQAAQPGHRSGQLPS